MGSEHDSGCIAYLSGAPRVSTRSEAEDGGPRAHVLGIIAGFRQAGWAVEPFIVGDRVPEHWVTEGSYEKKQGGRLKRTAVDVVRLAMRVKNNFSVRRAVRRRPDFVYERYACMQALGMPFQRQGVPWVLETNGLIFKELTQDTSTLQLARLARHLELDAYRRCDALVCVSEALKQLILAELDIPESKIIVLANGVDTEFFQPPAHNLETEADELNIGFVGSFVAWQALDVLLDVVAELRQIGANLRVTLVGGGPEQANLQQQARRLGIDEHVVFAGRLPRDAVPAAIAGFDLGYCGHRPTRAGAMYMSPLKLYEYMAMAKPVLAAHSADSKPLIADGETGFAFAAGDRKELKSAITCAMNKRRQLTAMGQQARQVIEREHSWRQRVQTLTQSLEPILESTTPEAAS